MPETLNLTAPRTRDSAPGLKGTVPKLDLAGSNLWREPIHDPTTGELAGWNPVGSFADVTVVGRYGFTKTLRLKEGQAALTALAALNNANLTTKGLRERLMEMVRDYVDENGATPYAGTLT